MHLLDIHNKYKCRNTHYDLGEGVTMGDIGVKPFNNVIFRSLSLFSAIKPVNVAAVMLRVFTPSNSTIESPGLTNPTNCDLGRSECIVGPSGVVSIMMPSGPGGAYTSYSWSFEWLRVCTAVEPKVYLVLSRVHSVMTACVSMY